MTRLLSLSAPLLLLATPAFAQDAAPPLPEAAAAMIDAAIANGDADDVQAVFNAARAAFPESAAQIDARWQTYQAAQAQRAAAAAAAQQEAIRQAGLFENWSGEGQIGGFQSSGNTDEIGVSTALSLNRDGINWQHRLRFAADYRRQDGTTTREQLLAQYEPRYQIDEDLFAFGLAQFERDNRQGYAERYVVSGGLGYRVLNSDGLHLSIKAGPAYRVTDFTDGRRNQNLAALFGVDFDWQITDTIKLTQDANSTVETGGEALVVIDSANTSITATTGLEATIIGNLRARASWAVEYDSNPGVGAETTDTLTRFTLIYGF